MSVLDHLNDYRVVKIALPVQGGTLAQLEAVAKVTKAPQFELIFLKGQLEEHTVAMDASSRITFDVAGAIKSIQAKVVAQPAPTKLLLEMVESFSYQQKREYFRVDAHLAVSWWRHEEEEPKITTVQATVNISGGGLRLPVAEKIAKGEKLGLKFIIDPLELPIECVGEVVGSYLLGMEISLAVKFVAIEDVDRDAIIAFCLAEQRRQLRLKVQVLDAL